MLNWILIIDVSFASNCIGTEALSLKKKEAELAPHPYQQIEIMVI